MFDLIREKLSGRIVEAGATDDGGYDFAVELDGGKVVRIPCDSYTARSAAALLQIEICVEVQVGRREPAKCPSDSPPWFRGRWKDWHRGHGCEKDDGRPRSHEGAAEIAAGSSGDGKGDDRG